MAEVFAATRRKTAMDSSAERRLKDWLTAHNADLQRFAQLIPLTAVAKETGLDPDTIHSTISTAEPAIYHVWSHTHAGKTRASKPYCLRLAGQDSVCLDWEDSVVAAAEAEFRRMGYSTCRELGTDDHIQCIIEDPDVALITAGVNLRDLWAQRRDGSRIDFWILEAKGKEAGGFDRYCFAEALSQLFEIPAEPLTTLLGTRRKASHGLCFRIANQLLNGWQHKGWEASVTLALLVPLWTPDMIWEASVAKHRSKPYYQRPYDEFVEFIEHGISRRASPRKGEAAFGEILDGLEANYSIRSLTKSEGNLRFRVLTTCSDSATGDFTLRVFPQP
jgi:hypothetical protein